MKCGAGILLISLSLLASVNTLTGCTKTSPVSYATNIQPLFNKYCNECHISGGAGTTTSGLNLDNYENAMKGTKFGPVIKAGDSLSSTLIILVENKADPSIKMPHGNRSAMSKPEIQLLKDWINQGAKNN